MQQGLQTNQTRQEIASALRFQQSLLRLGSIGQSASPKKTPIRSAESQTRQLATWAEQLSSSQISR
jgi:hypothetical protein